VRQLLSDHGQLDLFYDSPTPAGTSRIAGLLAEHLGQADYSFMSVTATIGESTVIGLSCQPH
jgi:hypothetical protein